jgi:4-hydroxy-tetrahydrodipicolinate synthase
MTSALACEKIRPIIMDYLAGDRVAAEAGYNQMLPLINLENRQCGLKACKTVMMEGRVIKSDAVRHPLAPLDAPVRNVLLDMAREHDLITLRWGK